MDNQEKIDNLITVVKTFARKFASIEEKIDTIEVKLDKMRVGIKESILPKLEVCTDIHKRQRESALSKSTITPKQYNENKDKEVKPAMYKRITVNLQELQSLFKAEDTWEINFIQGILDFTGQTVTEKQYEVLNSLADRVEYKKELAIKR